MVKLRSSKPLLLVRVQLPSSFLRRIEKLINKFNSIKDGKLDLCDLDIESQYIIMQMYISYRFFISKKIEFNLEDCYHEIMSSDHNYILFLGENKNYIISFENDINSLNRRKDIKLSTIYGGVNYTCIYVHTIIKSIHFYDDISSMTSKIYGVMKNR